MSTLGTWDKIIGSLGSTTTEFGGDWGNLISDLFNGIDIGLSDPTKKPIINTEFGFKPGKLKLFDFDASHHINISADDIDTGDNRNIRIRRMNAPFIEDFLVLEGMPQDLLNKDIDATLNTITNIGDTSITTHTSTKISITAKGQLNSAIAYEDEANTFTQAQTIIVPAGGAERIATFKVEDDTTGSELSIENITGSSSIFAPSIIGTQYTANDKTGLAILARIADAHDITNTTPVMAFNIRRPSTAVTNRPLLAIQNYTDTEYTFYKDKLDLMSNKIVNSVIDSVENTLKNIGSRNYDVFLDSNDSLWKARNTITGVITSSNASLTTVLQAAINALTPSRTRIETVKVWGAGTHDKITIPSFTRLDLTDFASTLVAHTSPAIVDHQYTNSDHSGGNTQIEIIGGIHDGNKANQYPYNTNNPPEVPGHSSTAPPSDEDTANQMHFKKVSGLLIANTTLNNSIARAVRLNECDDAIVYDVRVRDCKAEGIQTRLGYACKILSNDVRNSRYSFITTHGTPDCIIANNYGDTNITSTTGINISSPRNLICNNTIKNSGLAPLYFSEGTSGYDSSSSIAIGNSLSGSRDSGGIIAVGYRMIDAIICNNWVYNNFAAGIRFNGAHKNIMIQGNICHDNGDSGIAVQSAASSIPEYTMIRGNICYNNGKAIGGDSSRCGISLLGNSGSDLILNTIITDNICYDNQGTQTQKYGVRIANTDYAQVYQNFVRNNLTDGCNIAGTNTNTRMYENIGYSLDTPIATTNGIETFTNKNINGSTNTITNIGDSSISTHTSTKITITNKAQLNSAIAYTDQINSFGSQQTVSFDGSILFNQRRLTNTNGATLAGYYTELRDSGGANTNYAKIETRIVDNTDPTETGALDFYTRQSGTTSMYMTLAGPQLQLGLTNRAILDASGISVSSKTFTFPNTTGNLVVDAHANIFTANQKIQNANSNQLTLYRTSGSDVGIYFNEVNSTPTEINYAAVLGSIVSSTAGSETGMIKFQTRASGAIATRMVINHIGNLIVGTNQRLVLSESGLTAQQVMLFPNATSLLFGDGVDNNFGAHFFDMSSISAPSNPSANHGRFYVKQIDANNDGVFCLIKKAGSFVEVQIL